LRINCYKFKRKRLGQFLKKSCSFVIICPVFKYEIFYHPLWLPNEPRTRSASWRNDAGQINLMRYYIITYGCQMNKNDSERIAAILEQRGHKPASNAQGADLIVLNSCSIRQSAVDRIYGKINRFGNKKIIVAGCLLEYDKKRLAVHKNISFWHPNDYFNLSPIPQSRFSAFVPIMTGCNNFCSYCVVPYTRGREKSRPAKEIIAEVKSLIKKGYKEIILLGQNVNSYSYNRKHITHNNNLLPERTPKTSRAKSKAIDFPKLLKLINNLPGDFRLMFLTSHPKDMSDELIETIARCQKITPQIHLPVQSGDNQILRKMNRHYTTAHYKKLIKKIRAAFKKYRPSGAKSPLEGRAKAAPGAALARKTNFPPVTISTDIIVGFPGETKKQFQNTVKLCREIKFDKAYIAKYSPRPGTAAAKLKDDVSPKEKKRRWLILDKLINAKYY